MYDFARYIIGGKKADEPQQTRAAFIETCERSLPYCDKCLIIVRIPGGISWWLAQSLLVLDEVRQELLCGLLLDKYLTCGNIDSKSQSAEHFRELFSCGNITDVYVVLFG